MAPPRSRFQILVPKKYQTVRDAEGSYFNFRLIGLESLLESYKDSSKIVARELSKQLDLLKAPLEEYMKGYAPEKIGGPFNDEYHWSNDRPLLRDTIEARKALKATTLEVRMAWWGFVTLEGRKAQGPRSKPYRIELATPNEKGETVIYRRSTSAATVQSLNGISAFRRMHWAQEAYTAMKNNGLFRDAAKSILERVAYAVFRQAVAEMGEEGGRLVEEAYGSTPGRPTYYAPQLKAARYRRTHFNKATAPKQRANRGRPPYGQKKSVVEHKAAQREHRAVHENPMKAKRAASQEFEGRRTAGHFHRQTLSGYNQGVLRAERMYARGSDIEASLRGGKDVYQNQYERQRAEGLLSNIRHQQYLRQKRRIAGHIRRYKRRDY